MSPSETRSDLFVHDDGCIVLSSVSEYKHFNDQLHLLCYCQIIYVINNTRVSAQTEDSF